MKRIKKIFRFPVQILAENVFLSFLGLLLISLALGSILFYYCNNLIEASAGITLGKKPLEFNEEIYQKVLDKWQERDEVFLEADSRSYPNPFRID